MSSFVIKIYDEYENMDGWHKMELKIKASVGEHSYKDMELLKSEGDSVFLRNPDLKKITVTSVDEDSITLIVPYVYNSSSEDEERTVRAGETIEAVNEEQCGESLFDIGKVIEYELKYAIKITLEKM